jgi:hypothetical protein
LPISKLAPLTAGLAFTSAFKPVIDVLISHPRIGVQTEDPAIRRINASPYPFVIL